MELEVVGEDVLAEPDFGVGVEQTFVVVVGDSAAVLHFTDHVPHGRPRHALHRHTQSLTQQTLKTASLWWRPISEFTVPGSDSGTEDYGTGCDALKATPAALLEGTYSQGRSFSSRG